MKLSVIIPAYNEERTIRQILEKVLAVPIEKELLVVDDASSDATGTIVQEYVSRRLIQYYRHQVNSGKGYAIRTGIRHATGDIIIVQDADLEYEPNDYPAVIQPIVDGKSRISYGSRLLYPGYHYSYFSYFVGGKGLSVLTNFLYRSSITDVMTCYKAFRADLLKNIPLECTGFEFEAEVTAKALRRGEAIYEVPIRYYPRTKQEGKKIRWSDGLTAVRTLIKHRIL